LTELVLSSLVVLTFVAANYQVLAIACSIDPSTWNINENDQDIKMQKSNVELPLYENRSITVSLVDEVSST